MPPKPQQHLVVQNETTGKFDVVRLREQSHHGVHVTVVSCEAPRRRRSSPRS